MPSSNAPNGLFTVFLIYHRDRAHPTVSHTADALCLCNSISLATSKRQQLLQVRPILPFPGILDWDALTLLHLWVTEVKPISSLYSASYI